MILNKTFDSVLIGDHYLSLMTGLTLINKRQSVLLVDDERIQLDPLWGCYLNALNLECLRMWGSSEQIDALENIEHYGKKIPVRLCVGTTALYLSDSPFDNLRECWRKFPDIFGQETELLHMEDHNFNQLYQQYIEQLSAKTFHEKPSQHTRWDFCCDGKWPLLQKLFQRVHQKYCQLLKTKRHHPFVQLFTLVKALHHKEISWEIKKFESDHLLLCLLSPLYQLDHESLKEELKKEFYHRGGHYKRSLIHSWQFHKDQLNNLELESFEGVITPRQCYFMGQIPLDFPFDIETHQEPYQELSCTISNPKISKLIQKERVLYSQWNHFGHSLPLIDFSPIQPEKLCARIPFKKSPGWKPAFYHQTLMSFLDHAMRDIGGQHTVPNPFDLQPIKVEESPCSWSNGDGKSPLDHRRPHLRKLWEGNPLHHLSYWGSLCSPQLGFSRYLLDLRSHLP